MTATITPSPPYSRMDHRLSPPLKAQFVTVGEPAPSSASTAWWGCIGLGIGAGPKAIEHSGEQSTHTAHKEISSATSIASPLPQTATSFPSSVKREYLSGISPPGGSYLTHGVGLGAVDLRWARRLRERVLETRYLRSLIHLPYRHNDLR